MILRPTAFRIRNYKSILDSGICTLSGDGITVLAGQNEAGKTSILTALHEFNLAAGIKSKSQDYIPDHAPDSVPQIDILFEADIERIVEALAGDSLEINPSFLEAWRKQTTFWLFKQPTTGTLFLDSTLVKSWPKEDTTKPEKTTEADTPPEKPVRYATWAEIAKVLYELWPDFVYFDSFDDQLPREIAIDLETKSVSGVLKSEEPNLPQSVLDFLTLSGIDLTKVRELAGLENEKKYAIT